MLAFFVFPAHTVALKLLMPLLLMLAAGHVGWWLKGEHVTIHRRARHSFWERQIEWQVMTPYQFAAAKLVWAIHHLRLDMVHAVLGGWTGYVDWLAAGRRTVAGWVNRICPRGDISPPSQSVTAVVGTSRGTTQTATAPSGSSAALHLPSGVVDIIYDYLGTYQQLLEVPVPFLHGGFSFLKEWCDRSDPMVMHVDTDQPTQADGSPGFWVTRVVVTIKQPGTQVVCMLQCPDSDPCVGKRAA
jgi:hypothetical protein